MLDEFEQEELFMRAVYMEGGLKSAAISEPALKCFAESVHRLSEKGADLFIGGCSEVQVGLANIDVSLPCLDPFDILARRAVDLCYKGY
jgi:aspartate racemase